MHEAELKAAIARAGKSFRAISRNIGISTQSLYNKIHGHSEFKASEIRKIKEELALTAEELDYIFFREV